jgi:hypothetical protein
MRWQWRTPWPESASELYRPRDFRLSTKIVRSANFFVDRWCHMFSVTDPYGRILGFADRSRYYFFQVAPQLYSRGWVGPVSDPLLLRKSGSAGNRTRTSGSVAGTLTTRPQRRWKWRTPTENYRRAYAGDLVGTRAGLTLWKRDGLFSLPGGIPNNL